MSHFYLTLLFSILVVPQAIIASCNMAPQKPAIVLVHGAWQRPPQYESLRAALVAQNFTVLQPESATSGETIAEIEGKDYRDDVEVIHKAIEQPLAAGQEVVLVAHSYGGIPASAAAEGYQIQERRSRGLPGGISHIVYMAAFAFPEKGMSLLGAIGGSYAPFMNHQGAIVSLGEGAKDAVFNDVDSALADQFLAEAVYQSAASFETPASFSAGDLVIPKTYVLAEEDHALPPESQEGMISALENVTEVRVRTGHCIHLNAEALPTLVDAIVAAAGF